VATNRRRGRPPDLISLHGATTKLAAALVVGSIVAMGFGAYWLLLIPGNVLAGAIWQPITYGFIETGTMSLLFSAVILVSIGGMLESWWGARRVVRFLLGVTIASGVLTTLLAIPFAPLRYTAFAGGGAMATSAWVAYGWSLGRSPTSFSGIGVTGNQLAAIGIGLVVLDGVFTSFIHVLPELFAIALTYGYLRRR
jgi:membrane associated rhomboid family serine protease